MENVFGYKKILLKAFTPESYWKFSYKPLARHTNWQKMSKPKNEELRNINSVGELLNQSDLVQDREWFLLWYIATLFSC